MKDTPKLIRWGNKKNITENNTKTNKIIKDLWYDKPV